MKTLLAFSSLTLLCIAAAAQQAATANDFDLPQFRCGRVIYLAGLLQLAKLEVSQDVRKANDACGEYVATVRRRDIAKVPQALAQAGSVLDQFGLTSQVLYKRLAELANSGDPRLRFDVLGDLAKGAFNLGYIEEAQTYARELLQEAQRHRNDWNYGEAVYYGNFVLGRIAIHRGDPDSAARYLLAAGETPGSPSLNTFGPNITLAKELLEQGQTVPVLDFFARCKRFWMHDRGRLDNWIATIRVGRIPQFTENLDY